MNILNHIQEIKNNYDNKQVSAENVYRLLQILLQINLTKDEKNSIMDLHAYVINKECPEIEHDHELEKVWHNETYKGSQNE